jgi:hypothetical protein
MYIKVAGQFVTVRSTRPCKYHYFKQLCTTAVAIGHPPMPKMTYFTYNTLPICNIGEFGTNQSLSKGAVGYFSNHQKNLDDGTLLLVQLTAINEIAVAGNKIIESFSFPLSHINE